MSRRFGAFLVLGAAIALSSSALALAADEPGPAAPAETGAPALSAEPSQAVTAPTPSVVQPPAAVQPAPAPPQAPAPAQPAPDAATAPAVEEQRPEPPRSVSKASGRAKKKQRTARAAADGSVRIADFKFSPKAISVNVGDRVTWTNRDGEAHDATDRGNFTTGRLSSGESGSATFGEAGTFNYICTIHPSMTGTVRVAASGGGGDGGGSGGSSGSSDNGGAAGSDDSGSDDSGTDGSGGSGDDGADGGSLPATGADLWLITIVGLAMVTSGIVLRRRLTAGA